MWTCAVASVHSCVLYVFSTQLCGLAPPAFVTMECPECGWLWVRDRHPRDAVRPHIYSMQHVWNACIGVASSVSSAWLGGSSARARGLSDGAHGYLAAMAAVGRPLFACQMHVWMCAQVM